MSANSSLGDSPPAVDRNLASQYALRVALQTMKERCISLQQRLAVVEEENIALRSRCNLDKAFKDRDYLKTDHTELEALKNKVGELSRQKYQLTEHIAMVATENRQLWSRLSQLTKERIKNKKSAIDPSTTNSNLIRSKTFTQHSPNPLLRHKTIEMDISCGDLSLDDVSLKAYDDIIENKSQTQQKPDQILSTNSNSLGFTYLNDESSDGDLGQDMKKCNDGLKDIKMELMKQQSDLKVALSTLKQKRVLDECAQCKLRRTKPEMADKSLETDEELFDNFKGASVLSPPKDTTILTKSKNDEGKSKVVETHIDILEQKRLADEHDKICPMCGQIFKQNVRFENFCDHVQSHFLDDNDYDPNIEKNFEFISNSIGNF